VRELTIATVDSAVYRTDRHTLVNLSMFITACSMDDHDEEKRIILRSGKSEAEVTNNRRLRSTYYTIEAANY